MVTVEFVNDADMSFEETQKVYSEIVHRLRFIGAETISVAVERETAAWGWPVFETMPDLLMGELSLTICRITDCVLFAANLHIFNLSLDK